MPKTSIKPMLNIRKDTNSGYYTLVIQILRLRKRSLIFTPYKLRPEEFDVRRGVAVNRLRTREHLNFIESVNCYLSQQSLILHRIVAELELQGKPFGAAEIVAAFRQQENNRYVNTYFKYRIGMLRSEGKYGTAASLEMTLTAFTRFAAGQLYQFDDIDRGTVEAFRHHLVREGLKPNTVNFYICKLRAVYNRSLLEGYASHGADPFETVCIRIEKTRKLAVNDDILRQVAKAELSGDAAIARDLFLLSFYCRGMSFVDMAYLRKSDIREGTIHYRRRKTGQLFTVRILPNTQVIFDRYDDPSTPFALPILMHRSGGVRTPAGPCPGTSPDQRRQYERELYDLYQRNRVYYLGVLRTFSQRMGLENNLSFNMARHTWASRARRKGIAMSIISEGLGHTTEKTTRIYLEEMESKQIDEANKIITDFV